MSLSFQTESLLKNQLHLSLLAKSVNNSELLQVRNELELNCSQKEDKHATSNFARLRKTLESKKVIKKKPLTKVKKNASSITATFRGKKDSVILCTSRDVTSV